jgi:hypothetical protein
VIEDTERKMSGAVFLNITGNRQEFEITTLKLNDRIADSERELSPRLNGKSQCLIGRTQSRQVLAGEHQMIYASESGQRANQFFCGIDLGFLCHEYRAS